MGLIKAAQAATGTVMADQWKEFFYCDSLDNDTLLVRGNKRTGSRSSNTKAMIISFPMVLESQWQMVSVC